VQYKLASRRTPASYAALISNDAKGDTELFHVPRREAKLESKVVEGSGVTVSPHGKSVFHVSVSSQSIVVRNKKVLLMLLLLILDNARRGLKSG